LATVDAMSLWGCSPAAACGALRIVPAGDDRGVSTRGFEGGGWSERGVLRVADRNDEVDVAITTEL